MNRTISRSASVLALALAAQSFAAQDANKYLLRINVQPGDRYEYVVRFNVDGGDSLGRLGAQVHIAQRVTEVKPDQIDWSVYVAGQSVKGKGMMTTAESMVSDLNELKYKRSTDRKGSAGKIGMSEDPGAALATSSPEVQFPEQPVAVGETWGYEIDMSGTALNVTSKLVAVRDGLAIIESVFGANDVVTLIEPYRYEYDLKTGMLRLSTGKAKVNQMGVELSVNFTMYRLVPNPVFGLNPDGAKGPSIKRKNSVQAKPFPSLLDRFLNAGALVAPGWM